MCQVSSGQFGVGEPSGDAGIERIEGSLEQGVGSVMVGEDSGEAGTEETIIGSCEEEGGSEARVGEAIAMAVWGALDDAVKA
jgi:hypothetical protein